MSNDEQLTGRELQRTAYNTARELSASTVTVTSRPAEQDLPRVAPVGIGDVFRFFHRALRGWYILVIFLGLLMGAGGAYLGWKYTHPIYRSEAMIHIASQMPQVYLSSNQGRIDFDTFVQSQRALITSQLVVDKAVQKLNESGWQLPGDPYKFFATNLKVDIRSRSEFIQVSVTDHSPNLAWMAATAIVNAYQESYKDSSDKARIDIMRDDKSRLAEQRKTVSDDLEKQVVALHYGTSDLSPFYATTMTRVTKLRATLYDIDTAMALMAATPHPAAQAEQEEPPPAEPTGPLTAEQIAEVDPVMRSYLDERNQGQQRLKLLNLQNLGDAHPFVRQAKLQVEEADRKIEELRAATPPSRLAKAATAKTPAAALAVQTPEQLALSKTNLERMFKDASAEMERIGEQGRQLTAKEESLRSLKAEDEKLGKTIEALYADERLALNYKRIEVMGSGTIPLAPDRDLRLPVAAAAGGGGLVLPAALTILLSLLRRRYHYSDETASGVIPRQATLLGILPELPKDNSDAEQMAAAAHSVHQVRVSLMAQSRGRSNSYLITSAIAGEGKTSLTMSLGLSFAASQMKTLIIDADLIGRNLTGALEVREVEGLFESLKDGRLRERVRKLDTNLFVLPAGLAVASDACSLAPGAIKALLIEARKYFHMVIVDTGPILGSLEATVIAQEVDGVLFAIGRGQERHLVEKALVRLRSLDANLAGCVFNRAKSSDFNQSAYGSSSHFSKSDKATLLEHPNAHRLNRFGPLVQAVASRMPAMAN